MLQPTLTAQPSRSYTAVLLFLPALRALDFGPVVVGKIGILDHPNGSIL